MGLFGFNKRAEIRQPPGYEFNQLIKDFVCGVCRGKGLVWDDGSFSSRWCVECRGSGTKKKRQVAGISNENTAEENQ